MTAVLSTAQDAFFDVLKTVPLLLLVYALLYYIENRLTDTPALLSRTAQFGPAVGALAGILLNAILPGNDYVFGANEQGDTSVNFKV